MPQSKELVKKAHEALDRFLKGYRESGGGWAEFTEKDEENLQALIEHICEAKFEQDPDGSYPLEMGFVNRTRQERLHFFPQPYLHNLKTVTEYLDYIHTAEINASIANEDVKIAVGVLRDKIKRGDIND